ncbi:MAG TPA: NAD-dependent dehydratase [Anaerolineaceae bacterium]|nr:NAD-dependent dehydratase [Anaerolineaceae bacterium]
MSNPWQSKLVLVTGAAGFIGSRLTETLVQQGAQVRAFVRYTSRGELGLLKFLPSAILSEIELVFGDLRDAEAIEQAAKRADLIYHLGALISIPYSYLHPVEVVQTNILGTLNILQTCRKFDCRLIHTSSSEVYGTALQVPINESHPLQGQSPYSASKIGADKLVESYYRSFGVRAVTIRPFNTYGPGQSARAVIPTIITQALTKQTVYLGNLDALRDFTYVDDTVDAFIKAGQTDGIDGETFNLGSGSEISIRDLAALIFDLIGTTPEVEVHDERIRPALSEVQRLLADNSKARQVLAWSPQVDLREGLIRTIQWIREHLDFYHIGHYER